MFQKRCYLCGGKLLNGRCQECGLDNQKNTERNYRLNGSKVSGAVGLQMEGESDWQTRDIERKTARQNVVNEKAGNAKLKESQKVTSRPSASTGNSKMSHAERSFGSLNRGQQKKRIGIGVIIAIIVGVVGLVPNLTDYFHANIMSSTTEETANVYVYEYATRELANTGEKFEAELQQGSYQVGVHIPEGEYTINLKSGSGSAYLQDYENSIYLSWYFGNDSEQDEILSFGGARLYEGAILEVSGNVLLSVVTENGQNAKMTSILNPLKERFLLRKGEQAVVGMDFPAGVYDFHSVNGWTGINYQVPLHTDYEDDLLNYRGVSRWLSDTELDSSYYNVVLPVGTEITADDADVEMVPSEKIKDEEYDSYYVNY